MSAAPDTREEIQREASGKQHRASAPDVSSFVLANAGAGKTHLLVGRVIRLMLEGVEPERILCLTYTRAAAAEMSERLFKTLAGWVAMDANALISEIHCNVGHVTFKKEELDKARRLFTRALETPGGLKVQTIHAFCERLLQRFPVEAGIMPGFSVLDEVTERELLARARDQVLEHGGEAIADHVATVLNFAGEQSFQQLLQSLLHKRKLLVSQFGSSNTFPALQAGLNQQLGLSDSDNAQAIRLAFLKGLDWRGLSDAGNLLAGSDKQTDLNQARAIDDAVNAVADDQRFDAICRLLLKNDGNPKALSSLATKQINDPHPEIREMLVDLQEPCADALAKTKALAVRDATISVVAVGLAVIERYTAFKQDASAYDYADLIERTNELLTDSGQAAWVLYKLDKGLDHILIDEAQDTSPEQWDIITALTDEFFSGEGARDEEGRLRRTMFAVGDRKQSIYSFQGARPEIFDKQRLAYQARVTGAKGEFQPVELEISFRSAGRVLQAVDLVFAQEDIAKGVQSPDIGKVSHTASRVKDDGLVEIWDVLRDPPRESTDPWSAEDDDPTCPAQQDPANVRLARRIAHTISGWLHNEPLEMLADGRPVRASDILILVRERSSLMEAIVRALKDCNVPVAGADRLDLLSHITAQDLMALGRFVILPEDDLNLAALLKSPLLARDDGQRFNDDDDIFSLAHGRGTASLWQRFTGAVASGAPWSKALDRLQGWRADAARHGVFRFFANVLSRDNGRADFINAIGHEAGEPVDAFLQQCLEYERENLTSMAGFLAWLEDAAANLKRDMEQGAGEVRVMTVHGAKGLEAPIVFLPDTCSKPNGRKTSKVLVDEGAGELPVWHIKSDFEVDYTAELKQAEQDAMQQEYNRLLYVAMTRARDRLYVCGFLKSRKKDDWETDTAKEGTWYHAIHSALVDSGQDTVAVPQTDELKVWRFGSGFITPPDKDTEIVRGAADVTLDSWAIDPVPPVNRPERWLAPSKLGSAADDDDDDGWSREVALSPLAPSQDRRFRRGTLVHRLLQSLPELPPDTREDAARRYLSRQGVVGDQLTTTVAEVMRLFSDDRFAEVFSAEARAEVSIAAMIDPPRAERFGLSGQIDRLLVTDSRVLVVDFKTNRPPPDQVKDVPREYLRQLAAYAHVLREIFPGRSIECALLWTDAPELMAVPQAMLDAAWAEQVFTSA
jgi:ATP-dependent helicase/nuclease subunit A